MDEGASDVLLKERAERECGGNGGSKGRGAEGELVQEEFARHLGRIGGATRLAEMVAQPSTIQREGRWVSQAFMGYVRSNMEDPLWVSRILVGRSRAPSRQPGQGTRWGREG